MYETTKKFLFSKWFLFKPMFKILQLFSVDHKWQRKAFHLYTCKHLQPIRKTISLHFSFSALVVCRENRVKMCLCWRFKKVQCTSVYHQLQIECKLLELCHGAPHFMVQWETWISGSLLLPVKDRCTDTSFRYIQNQIGRARQWRSGRRATLLHLRLIAAGSFGLFLVLMWH